MKTVWFVSTLGLAALMVTSSDTSADSPSPLGIVWASPLHATTDSLAAIRVVFDKQAVDDAAVNKVLRTVPVQIEPELEVKAYWYDRHTLVIQPVTEMRPSTRYTVKLTGELAKRTRAADRGGFSFLHAPLRVVEDIGFQDECQPLRPSIELLFNQPVDTDQAIKGCSLVSLDGAHTVGLLAPGQEGSRTRVTYAVSSPLHSGVRYQFDCRGIIAKGGNEPLVAPYRWELNACPAFNLVDFKADSYLYEPENLRLELSFSKHVSLEQLRRYVRISPSPVKIIERWREWSTKVFEAFVAVRPGTNYTTTVNKNLMDASGQTLPRKRVFRFQAEKPSSFSALLAESGNFVIDTGSGGFPYWVRNIGQVETRCGVVPKDRVGTTLLDDQFGYTTDSKPFSWKKLGLQPATSHVSLPAPKDQWRLEKLNLARACAHRPSTGIYLTEIYPAEHKETESDSLPTNAAKIFGNVTNLGVVLKLGPLAGMVWVTGFSDAKPVPDALVELYDTKGKRLFSAKTDTNGLARLPGRTDLLPNANANSSDSSYRESDKDRAVIAVVQKSGDIALVHENWFDKDDLNWRYWDYQSVDKLSIRGLIWSDRGLYRPLDTVHLKGLVREVLPGKVPRVPRGSNASIAVEDRSGKVVFTRRSAISEYGGFSVDLPLTGKLLLGKYYVKVAIGDQTFSGDFSLEEFRPVSFEVTEKKAARHLRMGQPVPFELAANYLFGTPVANANVTWRAERCRHQMWFESYPDFSFSDRESAYRYDPTTDDSDGSECKTIESRQGRTDAQGRIRFAVNDPEPTVAGSQDYKVEAEIRDISGQTISKQVSATAHRSSFYLGIRLEKGVAKVNRPFAVQMVAVDLAGNPVAAKAKLSFIRQNPECVASGNNSVCKHRGSTASSRNVTIQMTGAATETIALTQPGYYVFRLEGKDPEGEKVTASAGTWIEDESSWLHPKDTVSTIQLVADKARYRPGETARLTSKVNIKGATTLVTLERNGIVDSFVIPAKRSNQAIEIPVTAKHAPNIYVSAVFVKGRNGKGNRGRPRLWRGTADLQVTAEERRLDVRITTDKQEYRPGEIVRGTIAVSSDGVPVQAEVSLSVADEGGLQLIDFHVPNPMDTIYELWGLSVNNSMNWGHLSQIRDRASFGVGAQMGWGRGYGYGGGSGSPPARTHFVRSAYWAAALETGKKGEAAFSFTAPDNLAAFRLMAVAADKLDKFGLSEARIRVNKNLTFGKVVSKVRIRVRSKTTHHLSSDFCYHIVPFLTKT